MSGKQSSKESKYQTFDKLVLGAALVNLIYNIFRLVKLRRSRQIVRDEPILKAVD